MNRKFIAFATALALALGTIAPTASAYDRDRHGYYGRGYDRHYDRRRHRDNDGDEIAAGVVGLVLGLALGAAVSQPRNPPPPQARCYDNYQRCAPPQGYYNQQYQQQGYDPRYSNYPDQGSAYERDYGAAPNDDYYEPYRGEPSCTRRERQWDRYANQYVVVDVPC